MSDSGTHWVPLQTPLPMGGEPMRGIRSPQPAVPSIFFTTRLPAPLPLTMRGWLAHAVVPLVVPVSRV